MKLYRKQDLKVLYQVCVFRVDGKTRWPAWPLIGWDISISPLKPQNGIQWNLTGSMVSMSSTKCMFFGLVGKTRWPHWHLIGGDIYDFSETAERNSTQLDMRQDLNVHYQVCVFGPIHQIGGTLYSGARYVALSASCLHMLLMCVFHLRSDLMMTPRYFV